MDDYRNLDELEELDEQHLDELKINKKGGA